MDVSRTLVAKEYVFNGCGEKAFSCAKRKWQRLLASTNALFCLKCRGESLETFLQKGVAAAVVEVVVIMYQKNLL